MKLSNRIGIYLCTKRLYKFCTANSRGGTIALSMWFLNCLLYTSVPKSGNYLMSCKAFVGYIPKHEFKRYLQNFSYHLFQRNPAFYSYLAPVYTAGKKMCIRDRSFNDFRIIYKTMVCFVHEIHLLSYLIMCLFLFRFFGRCCFIYQVKIERNLLSQMVQIVSTL